MWRYCLIGCYLLAVLSVVTVAETKTTTSIEKEDTIKHKRQTDKEVIAIGSQQEQQQQRQSPRQLYLEESEAELGQTKRQAPQQQQIYLEPRAYTQPKGQARPNNNRPAAGEELSHEVARLLQQLPYHHSHPHHQHPAVTKNEQQSPKQHHSAVPHRGGNPYLPQPHQNFIQYSPQPQPPPESNIHYVTEEEYLQLLKRQQEAATGASHQSVPKHKYRQPVLTSSPAPSISASTASEGLRSYKAEQQHRYSNIRPLADFDKELAQLIESNKPISFDSYLSPKAEKQPQTAAAGISASVQSLQGSHYTYATPEPEYQQITTGHYIQQEQKPQPRPQQIRFESQAPKYQFIEQQAQPSPYKQHYVAVQPQQQPQAIIKYAYPPQQAVKQPQHTKMHFYVAKDSKPAQRQPSPSEREHVEPAEKPSAMHLVEAPQLQYQKPQQTPRPAASDVQAQKYQQQPSKNGGIPARSGPIYLSQTTAGPPLPRTEKPELPPLDLKNLNRPLTQEEFNALVSAGYNLVPIPVAVPVKAYKNLAQQSNYAPQHLQQQQQTHQASAASRPQPQQQHLPSSAQLAQHEVYNTQPTEAATDSSRVNPIITYLRPLDYHHHIHGPSKTSA